MILRRLVQYWNKYKFYLTCTLVAWVYIRLSVLILNINVWIKIYFMYVCTMYPLWVKWPPEVRNAKITIFAKWPEKNLEKFQTHCTIFRYFFSFSLPQRIQKRENFWPAKFRTSGGHFTHSEYYFYMEKNSDSNNLIKLKYLCIEYSTWVALVTFLFA